jgi:hypothetical protein
LGLARREVNRAQAAGENKNGDHRSNALATGIFARWRKVERRELSHRSVRAGLAG